MLPVAIGQSRRYDPEMISVAETRAPQRRRLLPGYRAEVSVTKLFEPVGKTLVVTAPEASIIASLLPQIQLREELAETLWREQDEHQAMRLIDRITAIEDAWGKQGVGVRRKILWF